MNDTLLSEAMRDCWLQADGTAATISVSERRWNALIHVVKVLENHNHTGAPCSICGELAGVAEFFTLVRTVA